MAYRGRTRSQNGKFPIVFTPKDGYYDMPIQVPCGQCAGRRLDQSKQWALRCVHEAQVHDENCFITLTYNNENLPKDGSLNKRDFQLFMKRLIKEMEVKGQELELQEKRMILEAIQGGVDSVLKFGFLKNKGGK